MRTKTPNALPHGTLDAPILKIFGGGFAAAISKVLLA